MKKIIISICFTFLMFGLAVEGLAHCTIDAMHYADGCVEIWCFNAGANTNVDCVCGTPPKYYDCPSA